MSAQKVLLSVKVTPKAKQNGIMGWENSILKIRVTAPPEKGEANRAVITLLSKVLHLPQRNIILIQGATARLKLFHLEGITQENMDKFLSNI